MKTKWFKPKDLGTKSAPGKGARVWLAVHNGQTWRVVPFVFVLDLRSSGVWALSGPETWVVSDEHRLAFVEYPNAPTRRP